MRRNLAGVLALVAAGAILTLSCQDGARAQDEKPKALKIEFKVFPANEPAGKPLEVLELATIHYRSKIDGLPDSKFDLPVAGPDAKGFYSVEIAPGLLIDNLVIRPKGLPNVAVVTKLVTANNMVLYPGASDSKDKFKFPTYMSQMGVYRNLYREFVEDFPVPQQERNRAGLLAAFRPQLENMADLDGRLPEATDTERASAKKLRDEVISLYFNLPKPTTETAPVRRCCLFGWR